MMGGMLEEPDGGVEVRIRIRTSMLGLTRNQKLPEDQDLPVYAIVLVSSLVMEKKNKKPRKL